MYKILVRIEGAWREIKTSYNSEEIETYAVTQFENEEYMIVSVLRHHSGTAEEFQIKNKES